ncbi:hypothetical protein MMC30_008231 [Trapelia coarctata]|nr:hypothetical protein [Trapelia coarctata]
MKKGSENTCALRRATYATSGAGLVVKIIQIWKIESAVVNIITWNKAYALFPLPTFIHRKTYVLQKLNDYRGAQLLKYGQRGWKIQGTLWPEEETPSHPFQARRRIGDKFTWTIPFNTLNIRHSSTPDSVLEYSFFSVNTTDNDYDGLSTRYEVLASEFFACTLRHRYTFAGEPNSCFWLQLVGKRVGKLTFIEILKLKREDRVTHFQNYPDLDYSRLRDELTSRETLPETWTFYDDEIPKWHKAWEQGRMEKMIE